MLNNKARSTSFENLVRLRNTRRQSVRETPVNKDEVIAKVIEDINFLRDRIAHIKRAKKSLTNPTILNTYQSMLESRETVLASLSEASLEYFREQARFN